MATTPFGPSTPEAPIGGKWLTTLFKEIAKTLGTVSRKIGPSPCAWALAVSRGERDKQKLGPQGS